MRGHDRQRAVVAGHRDAAIPAGHRVTAKRTACSHASTTSVTLRELAREVLGAVRRERRCPARRPGPAQSASRSRQLVIRRASSRLRAPARTRTWPAPTAQRASACSRVPPAASARRRARPAPSRSSRTMRRSRCGCPACSSLRATRRARAIHPARSPTKAAGDAQNRRRSPAPRHASSAPATARAAAGSARRAGAGAAPP